MRERLQLMVSCFGWKFTLIFSIYIVLGAIIQGMLVSNIDLKKSIQKG
jgi:hypothetical protein